ncbi:MAG TPA: insulinase family protein [Bacteroidia bacterium]|nr:insulinase family protein [Bacteroidia bacterium]
MMKNILVALLFYFLVIPTNAQANLSDPLPIDTSIRTGFLPNGMKYYIKQNSKPEQRAEFRIAVNAGSTSENDNQQGLAHFVEHMAFNGTKNFKKNEIVDYLESVGTKFGAHLNAYTSFDETVYMIQLPTDKPEIVDKGLQILEEWAHNLLFDSLEVEKERGVVVEEWRLGQGADERMRRKYWPVIFQDSRYAERLPIGKKDIIENSKRETLEAFYKDWYRPDLMAVIAIGDFDPAVMEKMIRKQFSNVKAVSNPRPVVSYPVGDNKEVLVATAVDKEATYGMVQMFYKQPREIQKTVGDYRRGMSYSLFSGMLNARTEELQRQAVPPFMYAASGYGDLVRTKYAYYSVAACKEDGIEKALETLVMENERVRRFGFTESELKRQKAEVMSRMEKAYNERNKTESRNFAREYVSNFLSEEPIPGIEFEMSLYRKYLDGITLEEVNSLAKKWITSGENCVAIITAPDKETTRMPSDARIKEIISTSDKLVLEAYKDEVSDEPLVEKPLVGAKVKNEKLTAEYGITEWELENGVRVLMKPTDFKNDEVLFTGYSWGGWSSYPESDYWSASSADNIIDQSGVGSFNATALEKKLTGKLVSLTPYISELQQGFNGSCAPKDIETMFQLTYKYFTEPRKDEEAFQSYIEKQKGALQNRSSDPQSVFFDSISYVMANYNPRYQPRTLTTLSKIELDMVYKIYQERFSDASGFTFVLVGSMNPQEIKPLVEKYLGSLPSLNKNEKWVNTGVTYPKGKVEKTVRKGMEPKAAVLLRFNTSFEYNRNNRNEVSALSKLFNIRLREVLREDKSGVYGVSCWSSPKHYPVGNLETSIYFGCSPENVDMLIDAAWGVLNEIKTTLCDEKNLIKVKETALRERETGVKENQFWLRTISSSHENGEDILELKAYNSWVSALTVADLKNFANKYLVTENYAKFVLLPEK